jgi:hypothetical protein
MRCVYGAKRRAVRQLFAMGGLLPALIFGYDTLRLEPALRVSPPGAGKSRLASGVAECRGIRSGGPLGCLGGMAGSN